jgi:CheY-like chemotaxis protein
MKGTILLVEDDPDDASSTLRAFAQGKILNPIQLVRDGQDAICYLLGGGRYNDRGAYPLPIFVLLDLTLPQVSGLEFLEWLRSRSEFEELPVIVITGLADLSQINKAYQAGACSFLLKPFKVSDLTARLAHLKRFRIGTNPNGERLIELT